MFSLRRTLLPLLLALLGSSLAAESSHLRRNLEAPLTPVIRPLLLPYALQGGAEFSDPASYQSKALDRLALQVGVTSFSTAKLVQYYVLYCIYEATNAVPNVLTYADSRFANLASSQFPTWIDSNGWSSLYTNWDPCRGRVTSSYSLSQTTSTNRDGVAWAGITCDAQSRVVEISLVNNLMTGAFPPEIKLLASDGPYATGAGNLNYLELYHNEFLFNDFDNSWITDLGSNLEYLYVGFTGFAGDFPELPVGVLEVDFSYTLIQKGFTDSVFAFSPFLEYLALGGNDLNTTLPTALSTLPNLKFLYVNDCALRGNLNVVQAMPSIFELWIDGNPLMGQDGATLPQWLGQKTTLASLSLTANDLRGTIPSTLGNLVQLQQLWLYDNKFVGSIPTQMGALVRLKTLEVEGNGLRGQMPGQVCDLSATIWGRLDTVGADCSSFTCPCCTCCDLLQCQPDLYWATPAPTPVPVFTMPVTARAP